METETLREKSKRLFKQIQIDTEEKIKENFTTFGKARDSLDPKKDMKIIIDTHLLDLNEDILKIKGKIENIIANPTVRPDVRKDLLDIISLLA